MGDKKARVGEGDVTVVLCDEPFVLEPSLEACIAICKLAGDSAARAAQRCINYDFEFIVEVLALGMGATSPALKKDLRKRVYQTGMLAVMPDALLFVRTIMNGGRVPKDDEAATSLDLLDRLGKQLPSEYREFFEALEPLRNALSSAVEEAGEEVEVPLAAGSESPSENSIDA